jgi:ankyrin repeat protein
MVMPDVFLPPASGISPFTMEFTEDTNQPPGDVWIHRPHAPLKFEHPTHPALSQLQQLWLATSYFPDPAVVKSILRGGLDPDAEPSRIPGAGLLPLEFAARRGNIAVVKTLLAAGARAGRGMPYLWAAYTDNTDVMALLATSGADPLRQAGPGESVLAGTNAIHFAASNGARAAMRHLVVELGADIDAADPFGRDSW